MDQRARRLIDQGDALFGKRATLMSLWQEEAEHFYPERADFTATRTVGEEFASHLMSSYPILVRRDLGDAFSAMLRPASKDWFSIHTNREEYEDEGGRQWLERSARVQRRAMYDRISGFSRATKEADHDYATFGNAVITVELNVAANALLYRSWHLRDVAWAEGYDGHVENVHRKWKPCAATLARKFPRTISRQVSEAAEKNPYIAEFNCRHIVLPADDYQDGKSWRTPWVSIYIDTDNSSILEEVGVWNNPYIIPRWQTVSGSQYANSPAAVAALPEARLIQAMTLTLLEAGEMGVRPPLVATQGALKSEIEYMAGGITYVDADYNEKGGAALRPLEVNGRMMPLGMEMMRDARSIIETCFYINRLSMPPAGTSPEMTAFEVGQRVQQYIRQALPLFEPLEHEYNGALCDLTFDILFRAGAFGALEDIPASLRGQDLQFRFTSPLHEAIESQKGQKMMEANALLAQAVQLDPGAGAMIDAKEMLRDALRGIAVPAQWLRTEDEVAQIDEMLRQQRAAQQLLGSLQAGANVAKTAGEATQAFAGAGLGGADVAQAVGAG